MGQFFFDPNEYAVGTGFSDLPFTQISGDSPDQFEIVEVDGQNVLQIVIVSGGAHTFLFDDVPETKSGTEVFQRAELLNYTELRYYTLLRASTGNERLRTTMRRDDSGPPDRRQILIFDANDNASQLDNYGFGNSPQWPISWLESLQGTSLVMTVWDDTSSQESPIETRTYTDNVLDSETVSGRPGFGTGRPGTMNLYFLGVGDEGDAAPQSFEDAGNGDDVDPVEPGTRVNFPSLPATATIVTTGGIDSEDQLVEVSTVAGWGSPPFLVAIGDEEPFDVALVLDVDDTTITLLRDYVDATTPASHANGVAIRPALIGDQLERIYAEFSAISSVLDGYDPPTFPETGDPNQSWTT